MSEPMLWNDKPVVTIGDLIEAISTIEDADQGAAFMAAYLKVTPHAYANVGYAAGYLDFATQHRIYEYTGTAHPFTGRSKVTAKEAFDLGRRLALETTR